MATPRSTYVIARAPIEPCDGYPSGVGGCTLTARLNEAEANYWKRIASASTAEMGFTYTCTLETLQ